MSNFSLPVVAVSPTAQVDNKSLWRDVYAPALARAYMCSSDFADGANLLMHGRLNGTGHWDIERVARAQYVLIDLTDLPPVGIALLGAAVAYKKRLILLSSNQSDVSRGLGSWPDLTPWVFNNTAHLASYLEHRLDYEIHSREARPLMGAFERLGVNIQLLEGDGVYTYAGRDALKVHLRNEPWTYPYHWNDVFTAVLEEQRKDAHQRGAVFFNGDLLRVVDYVPDRDETLGRRSLRLILQPTDYEHFVASNYSWDHLPPRQQAVLRKEEIESLTTLRGSNLANPLTVFISLVVRDAGKDWIVVQQRNAAKAFHGRYDYQCSAAGMVSASRDVLSGEVSPASAAANELREETGVWVDPASVSFLALARELECFEIGLLGEVQIEGNISNVLGLAADTFESTGFEVIEAVPSSFASWFVANQVGNRMGALSLGTVLLSLARRHSLESIEAALLREEKRIEYSKVRT